MRADFFGDTLVGPTILQWATEEQKQRFIPGILNGTISWCQGFSEPDAGSDLASLKTRAELDGDEWVVNGQKVWTTQAQFADYIFLLARTDPDAPKHAGISYLLMPMKQPGIEVRPIEQVDGSADFNEVFFTNARCPRENVVGGENNGWKVAMTTLGFERGSSATTGYRRFQRELDHIIAVARKNGRAEDPLIRQRLATVVDQRQDHGDQRLPHPDRRAQRHPPHGGALAPATRCSGRSPTSRRWKLAMDILGMDGQILTGHPDDVVEERLRRGRADYPVSDLQASFFFSRSETIWGGTARDPAQHRGRESPRTSEGAEARLSQVPAVKRAAPGSTRPPRPLGPPPHARSQTTRRFRHVAPSGGAT